MNKCILIIAAVGGGGGVIVKGSCCALSIPGFMGGTFQAIGIIQKAIKNGFEMHFACEF